MKKKVDWKPFLELGGITAIERIVAGEKILNRLFEQALKAQREEILKEVLQEFDLELEAWMDVHEERQRTFQTKELLKHMRNKLCLDKLK